MMQTPAIPYNFNLTDMAAKPLMQGGKPSPLRLIGVFVFETRANISKYVMVHKRLRRKVNEAVRLVV